MGYSIEYGDKWIHIVFRGQIDGCDVIQQTGDPHFQSELSRIKRVIYDYSQAEQPSFNEETIREFGALGKLLGELSECVDVVCVPSDPDRIDRLEAYKRYAETDKWKVTVARTPEQAIEVMLNLVSQSGQAP